MNDIPPEYTKALNTALNILGYADNTERRLREKLSRKGCSREAADYAVAYAKRTGALNDARFLDREAHRIAEVKLYGIRRITAELYAKGFSRSDIEGLDLSDVSFPELCAKRIKKTAARFPEREKMYAALLRYGYTSGDIAAARAVLADEKEEKE